MDERDDRPPKPKPSAEYRGADGRVVSDAEAQRQADAAAAEKRAADDRIKKGMTTEMFQLDPPSPEPKRAPIKARKEH